MSEEIFCPTNIKLFVRQWQSLPVERVAELNRTDINSVTRFAERIREIMKAKGLIFNLRENLPQPKNDKVIPWVAVAHGIAVGGNTKPEAVANWNATEHE